MSKRTISPVKTLRGEITPPADKSISHRAVMFGALADGTTRISNCLMSADVRSTIGVFRSLGVSIDADEANGEVMVRGAGINGLKAPDDVIYTGNSGTTTRLMSGILAGQGFESVLSGDESLNSRPMKRIIEPLCRLGADIRGLHNPDTAPLKISPSHLTGTDITTNIASAQVKSAIILAGLYADGKTTVTEPSRSRDHTERMLKSFGADISVSGLSVTVERASHLTALDITVPSDISSAAFFIAAALLTPHSDVLIRNVCVNPTRAGILKVCEDMGADISMTNTRQISGENVCDLIVKHSALKATVIEGDIIPALIDEIPVIAVMASSAKGTTIIRDAADLKAKESDRIATTTEFLTRMGADVTPTDDGMIIEGLGSSSALKGALVESKKDHRIAMSETVAALNASSDTVIIDADCTDISYPGFYSDMESLTSDH
mgnify:CR=1 FL=1